MRRYALRMSPSLVLFDLPGAYQHLVTPRGIGLPIRRHILVRSDSEEMLRSAWSRYNVIGASTISRLRCRTRAIATDRGPVTVPNAPGRRTSSATFGLQISFLLGRQWMLGHEPPISWR